MPESESLVSKLREYAHLECPSKPGNPAEFVVDVDVEEIRLNKCILPSHLYSLEKL